MSFLDRIRPAKRREVRLLQEAPPATDWAPDVRSLHEVLKGRRKLSFIAEIKRRSPSRGDLRKGAEPISVARAYEAAGASAISVLTDGPHFGGALRDLVKVRAAVGIPVLRKDFILDELQLDETRAIGADAALLIVAFLKPARLTRLLAHAHEIGLEVLVETHDDEEVRLALDAGARIVGTNNRNLHSLQVDLAVSEALLPAIPRGVLKVAESGLKTRTDARRMFAAGAHGVLVGTALMAQPDVGEALKQLGCG
ncbi:MAG TPA: indole-3-glycerol phosphate synthase TrpC [Myxococcota bacterium]|nr:indole-3-glycerol phosphate synthase TrpC [Myxococcota bacterium]